MKKVFTTMLTLGSVVLLMLSSCKKDEVKVVASAGTASALTASTTTPALVKANLTASAVTFTSTAPSYGYSAVPANVLQIAVKGTNFAKPAEVTLAKGASTTSYNVKDFNNLLLSMNLPTGVAAQVEVRVKSSLSATAGIVYSNVLSLTATPFALVSYIYVPGAYQGWNPATADSLQSATGNGVYTGIINFGGTDQHFKITPQKKWDVAYGDAGSGKVSTSGGDILLPSAGQYYLTVDLNANTFAYAKADYFSVIGSAAPGTAWSTDTDLKFNNGTTAWEGTMAFTVGEFKYRMNHDWAISFGIPKTGADGSTLNNSDNNNVPIATAGTYKVTFTPVYSSDPAKLGLIDRALTAKYTVVKQ